MEQPSPESQSQLPESVTSLNIDGREVYLVGTAHVSKESVEDVKRTVEIVRPDTVAVELCPGRYKSIVEKDSWEKMNIFKVIRERKSVFLMAQLIMTSFYKRLGRQFGVEPGAEMIQGINSAKQHNAEILLADRDVEITLKRVWGSLSFWNKLNLLSQVIASVFVGEEIDEQTIEEMKKKDQLEAVMEQFSEKFPGIKERLIDERDIFLAEKIRTAPGQKIVAVVGAGHTPGIQKHINTEHDLGEITKIPPPSKWMAVFKWALPVLIIALLAAGFIKGGTETGTESVLLWILVNGIFSAVGTAAALGHPLSVVTAFIAAPLTSLYPLIAAGFPAGIVQAWVRKPTVADFKDLPHAIESVKGFWTNPVIKIFMVVVFANLGSAVGTWVAIGWISKLLAS